MLIAEIGLNHKGSIDKFKEMVLSARDHGADVVKSQAFEIDVISKYGSMPRGFYEQCYIDPIKLIELIQWSRDNGIELFFSIFGEDFDFLVNFQKFHKMSRKQFEIASDTNLAWHDRDGSFISMADAGKYFPFQRAKILYVTEYVAVDPELHKIGHIMHRFRLPVGLSDHTRGVDTCLKAIDNYGVSNIECHFILESDKDCISHNGKLYRDCVHSKTPKELELIAKAFKH